MKVLYIHQYFKTPLEGGGLRSYYLAKALVEKGLSITMVTSHNDTQRIHKKVDGIDVIYLPVPYSNHMSFTRRAFAFLRFTLLALFESTRHRQVDLCYVMTTPLSTGIIALFNKYLLGRPYIFEVGDLWPKVPADMGLLRANWKQKVLEFLERLFYRKAKGLIGLSLPITAHLKKIAPKIPATTVYNISDCSKLRPMEKNSAWVAKFEVANQFVISYTGTFGLANNLSSVVALAEHVQDLPVCFMLVGQGAEKQKVKNLIDSMKLNNVRVYDHMIQEEVKQVINISDAMIVSFGPVESLHTGSPNKFFDALAAGKPIITNFRGWIGELIESEKCGFVAESVESFRENLELLMKDNQLYQAYCDKSRKLAEERFDLSLQANIQLQFIEEVVS